MSIKKYTLLLFAFLLGSTVFFNSFTDTQAAGPPFEGRIYNETSTLIPPSGTPDSNLPRVRWCWDDQGDNECGDLGGSRFPRPDSWWFNESPGKYFKFDGTGAPGCGPEISNNQMTVYSNETFPGQFSFVKAQSPIYDPETGHITGWRDHPTIDAAYDRGGNPAPYYRVFFNYITPLEDLSCLNLNINPTTINQGQSATLTSQASTAFDSAIYVAYNRDNVYSGTNAKPVCVLGGANSNGQCPQGGLLIFNGTPGQNNTASITLPYNDIYVLDINNGPNGLPLDQRLVRPSFNAYFRRGTQQTPGIDACIRPLDLVPPIACESITPRPSIPALSPDSGARTVSSRATAPAVRAFYAFYNKDNPYDPNNPDVNSKPFCVEGLPDPDNVCPGTSGQLKLNANLAANGLDANASITYALVNRPDANWNNQVPTNLSITAFFTDSQNRTTASINACITSMSISHDIPEGPQCNDNCIDPAVLGYDQCTRENPAWSCVLVPAGTSQRRACRLTNNPTSATCQPPAPNTGAGICSGKTAWKNVTNQTNGEQIPNATLVRRGDEFFYRVGMYTNGQTPGLVTMEDTLPQYLEFIDDDLNSSGVRYNATTRKVSRTLGDGINIPQSSPMMTQFKVRVSNTAPLGTSFINIATITSEGNSTPSSCQVVHVVPLEPTTPPTTPPAPICRNICIMEAGTNTCTPNRDFQPGDRIQFKCAAVPGISRYGFQLVEPDRARIDLTADNFANISKVYEIRNQEDGRFSAECRILSN